MKLLNALFFSLLTLACSAPARAAEFVLGPGDGLRISVYGQPDLALETRLSESGSIRFPLLGEVKLMGLEPAAAEARIAGLLDVGGFVRKPHVNIAVTQFNSKQIAVLGQVNRPGRYPADGKHTLTDVIAQAGGIAADGGDTVILVQKRDGSTSRSSIDLSAMVRGGNLTHNVELMGDDVIYVERAPKFYIDGEVQRPGAYRLEHGTTMAQALAVAGGLSQRGTERGARIKRADADGNLHMVPAAPGDVIRADDVIHIKESLF